MRRFPILLAIPVALVFSACLVGPSQPSWATTENGWDSAGNDLTRDARDNRELQAGDTFPNHRLATVITPETRWRRTKAGWERTIDWQMASAEHPTPNLAGQFHPALLALMIIGVAVGSLVAGTPEHLLLSKGEKRTAEHRARNDE